jgi:hypothetical protein
MPRPGSWTRHAAVLALGLAPLGAACGGDDDAAGCGPIRREALDSAYLVHVVGDDTDVAYQSDPPTSGPHQPAPAAEGVVDEPLSRPVQVGILERGDVLLQHGPGLDDEQEAELADLAGPHVVVAPNPDLGDPIVATAWTYKRSCRSFDGPALREFVEERAGKGPEG